MLTSVLTSVKDGGDTEEEDDCYYSSNEDEGTVTAEIAKRGVGEAGRVVVADSIWNKLVPKDLLRVDKRLRERRSSKDGRRASRRRGPVDDMLKSLRVTTGGLHKTSAPPPPTAHMFLTYKNALKCRAILDARDVNDSDPRRPPRFGVGGNQKVDG